ncbi:MAG: ATP-binding cassette domain-containing protein [Galactobacter sp.]
MVDDLYPAEHASLELLRMTCEETQVILLDEVSAAFDDHEISLFHALASRLAAEGRSLLFVSHRLDEIQSLSDRIVVMREGVVRRILIPRETRKEEVVSHIFDASFDIRDRPDPAPVGVLPVAMKLQGAGAGELLHDIDLEVFRGEVLGITGSRRSGISDLAELLGGRLPVSVGTMEVDGNTARLAGDGDAKAQGIAYVPEADLDRDVDDDAELKNALRKAGGNGGSGSFAEESGELQRVIRLIQRLGIRTKSMHQLVGTLSGGDRNKVALARVLAKDAQIFILNQPTRGIDVRSKADLYGLIDQMCAQGSAVVLVSSDLSELMGYCQRIAVMRQGELVDVYRNEDVTEDSIMLAALGWDRFDSEADAS